MRRWLSVALAATAALATSHAAAQTTVEKRYEVVTPLDEQRAELGEPPFLRLRAGVGLQLPMALRGPTTGTSSGAHDDPVLGALRGEIEAFGLVLEGDVRDHGPVSEPDPRAPTTFEAATFYDVMIGWRLTRTYVTGVAQHRYRNGIIAPAHDEVRRDSITPLLGMRVLSLRDRPPTPEGPDVVARALEAGALLRIEGAYHSYTAIELEPRAMYVPSSRSLAVVLTARAQIGGFYAGPEIFVYGRQMAWLSLEAGVALDL